MNVHSSGSAYSVLRKRELLEGFRDKLCDDAAGDHLLCPRQRVVIIKLIFLSEKDERRGRGMQVFFGEWVIVMSTLRAMCRICRNRWIHFMYIFSLLLLSHFNWAKR
jgi:hypothetical protein